MRIRSVNIRLLSDDLVNKIEIFFILYLFPFKENKILMVKNVLQTTI